MVRLRRYSDFILESSGSDVPDRFIPIDSIGQYLDPYEGVIYAMLVAGGYEDDPYDAEYYLLDNEEAMANLSPEEREAIDSAHRSVKEVVEPQIDWYFIEDIRQVALAEDITDQGIVTMINVHDNNDKTFHSYNPWVMIPSKVYYRQYFGGDMPDYWKEAFGREFEEIREGVELGYQVQFLKHVENRGYKKVYPESRELFAERLVSMHPDKKKVFSVL